jgi:hypothetical protein
MNRKTFLSKTSRVLMAAGAAGLILKPQKAPAASAKNDAEQSNSKQQFVHSWIKNLVANLDGHLDEKTKAEILEACGRACATVGVKNEALKFQGDLNGWLAKLKTWLGAENVQQEASLVRIRYAQCLCPLVKCSAPLLTPTFCNCSRGWVKEVFETVTEKAVQVTMEESIMSGGAACRFTIMV